MNRLYTLFQEIETWGWSFLTKLWLRVRFPWVAVGKGLSSRGGMPFVHVSRLGRMSLGQKVTFVNATRYNGLGINKRSSIVIGPNAELFIDDNSGFSGVSICCAHRIRIGSYVMVGGNCFIWDTDFHSIEFADRKLEIDSGAHHNVRSDAIEIKEGAFIGANSIILKGVTVGRFSVVGAGSVVTADIPDSEIWAGNPARFIRNLK